MLKSFTRLMSSFTGQDVWLTLVYFCVTLYMSSWHVCVLLLVATTLYARKLLFFTVNFNYSILKDYRSNEVLKINIWSFVLLVVYKVYVISQAIAWFRISKLSFNENIWELAAHVLYKRVLNNKSWSVQPRKWWDKKCTGYVGVFIFLKHGDLYS